MPGVTDLVRQYKALLKRERHLTSGMPFKHVVRGYPFNETSEREARQELLEDVRRRLNALPGLIIDEIAGKYKRQLIKLDAEYRRSDAGDRAEILREQAELVQKLRQSNLKAELDKLLEEPKREKRLPHHGAGIPGHPAARILPDGT